MSRPIRSGPLGHRDRIKSGQRQSPLDSHLAGAPIRIASGTKEEQKPWAGSYPRFIRDLNPSRGNAFLIRDPIWGWPRLPAGAVAAPVRGRRAIDWSNRAPSKQAYAAWVRESEPLPNIGAVEPAEAAE